MSQDRITLGFSQFCQGARDADLSLYGGYRAGYLRALNDSADLAQNLAHECHPDIVAALMELADGMRQASLHLVQR